ncbi:hypothetical protein [Aphanothece sacrum]|uniref:Transposase n=1 Tax=Aphanothece sacrum FPU1 TaxID=1920663 RepID=A0A401IMA3_APHSA|nr:hypothetical protein [Aphanothece sacrum]GBF82379.1 transposase [Aphanothece sacrum FPU1]GBF84279.1 transposase [Aphanothece sacrum FPU3]
MSNYRRLSVSGGTYFITQVTYHRQKWLCSEIGRKFLREAIEKVLAWGHETLKALPDDEKSKTW